MYQLSDTSFSVSAKLENQEQKELVNKVLTKIQEEKGVVFDSFRTAFMWMVNHFDGENTEVNQVPKTENEPENQISEIGPHILISDIAPSLQDFREKNETNVNEDWTDLEVVRHALDKDATVITKERELADNEVLLSLTADEVNCIVTINENRNAALAQLGEEKKDDPEFSPEDFEPETIETTILESLFNPAHVLHKEQFYTGISSLKPFPSLDND